MDNKERKLIERYLFNDDDDSHQKINEWVKTHLLGFLKKNFNENESDIDHVIDFLNSDECPRKITRLGYSQAKYLSQKWTQNLNKKKLFEEFSKESIDINTIKETDYEGQKFYLVQLISKEAFEFEGSFMQHCVSSYFKKRSIIYSIRDSHNKPHVTIEVKKTHIPNQKCIVQVKGKQNENPILKYQIILRKLMPEYFTNNNNYIIDDRAASNVGIIHINDKLLDIIDGNPPNEIEITSTGSSDSYFSTNHEYIDSILSWLSKSKVKINSYEIDISTKSFYPGADLTVKNYANITIENSFESNLIKFENLKFANFSTSAFKRNSSLEKKIIINTNINPTEKLTIVNYDTDDNWDDHYTNELSSNQGKTLTFQNEVELNTKHLKIDNSLFINKKKLNIDILEINFSSEEDLQNLIAFNNNKFRSIIITGDQILWKHIDKLSLNIECDLLVLTESTANLKDLIKHKEVHISVSLDY